MDDLTIHQLPDASAPAPADDLPMLGAPGAHGADDLPPDFPVNAVMETDGSVMLTLRYPVVLKFRDAAGAVTSESYSALHMKRFTGKTLREVQSAPAAHYAAQMIASSTGLMLGKAEILHDQMDAADISAVLRVGLFFIMPGRKTGR